MWKVCRAEVSYSNASFLTRETLFNPGYCGVPVTIVAVAVCIIDIQELHCLLIAYCYRSIGPISPDYLAHCIALYCPDLVG